MEQITNFLDWMKGRTADFLTEGDLAFALAQAQRYLDYPVQL